MRVSRERSERVVEGGREVPASPWRGRLDARSDAPREAEAGDRLLRLADRVTPLDQSDWCRPRRSGSVTVCFAVYQAIVAPLRVEVGSSTYGSQAASASTWLDGQISRCRKIHGRAGRVRRPGCSRTGRRRRRSARQGTAWGSGSPRRARERPGGRPSSLRPCRSRGSGCSCSGGSTPASRVILPSSYGRQLSAPTGHRRLVRSSGSSAGPG